MIRSRALLSSSLFSLLAWSSFAPLAQEPVPKAQDPVVQAKDPTLAERLAQWRKELRTDPEAVAAALRSVDLSEAVDTDRLTWLRLARDTAVRVGDARWLQQLSREVDPFSEVWLYRVLLAGGHLAEGDLGAAKQELARIDDIDRVNDRDKRRYFALQARIAQLEGDRGAEVAALRHIVDELQYWPRKSCQGCHDDPKNREVPPLLPVLDTWFVDRLVQLERDADDLAPRVERAKTAVRTAPQDPGARIQLAVMLLANGDRSAAEATLADLPWVLLPGRDGGKPRMMTIYP